MLNPVNLKKIQAADYNPEGGTSAKSNDLLPKTAELMNKFPSKKVFKTDNVKILKNK